MAQTNHDSEIWEIIVEVVKWVIAALVALVTFFLKGYYDEFKELKENDKKQGDILTELKHSIESLSKDIQHLDKQVKTYANGDRIATEIAMKNEDAIKSIETKIHILESKIK